MRWGGGGLQIASGSLQSSCQWGFEIKKVIKELSGGSCLDGIGRRGEGVRAFYTRRYSNGTMEATEFEECEQESKRNFVFTSRELAYCL